MANPLTLIMPLVEGVNLLELAAALDGSKAEIDTALTSIGTVHYARFVLFDASSANLQPSLKPGGPFSLSVITDYDGSFTAYIQDFVNQIGDVFDKLLAFVVGGEGLIPVSQNVQAFTEFIAANDASQNGVNKLNPLYNAYSCTVQQVLAADPCPETTS